MRFSQLVITNVQKVIGRDEKTLENFRVCDIIGELSSNGMLPH
jgi:hypothetical protein